jgi:hypothetical protein
MEKAGSTNAFTSLYEDYGEMLILAVKVPFSGTLCRGNVVADAGCVAKVCAISLPITLLAGKVITRSHFQACFQLLDEEVVQHTDIG